MRVSVFDRVIMRVRKVSVVRMRVRRSISTTQRPGELADIRFGHRCSSNVWTYVQARVERNGFRNTLVG